MNKPAAIYARVSSDRQKESHTIGSQTSALVEYAQTHGYAVPSEWVLQDEGYSGASLVRPGLEALRDLAAQGQIVAVLIYSPGRLSRKYAYQVLLGEELSRCGVDVIYLKSPSGDSPEDQLVVQFQGMIAEYERAQIAERHRRGETTSSPTRNGECVIRSSLRLSLCEEDGHFSRILRSGRKRSRRGPHGVCDLHATTV